jgi:hypothetical protein
VTSVAAIIVGLNRTRAALVLAFDAATVATRRVRELQEQAALLGVRDVINRFSPVLVMTEQLAKQISAGLRQVDDAIRLARMAAAETGDDGVVERAPAATGQPPAPTFVRTRPEPAAIDEIRRHVGRRVAAGRLYGVDGTPLTPLVGPGDTGLARGPFRTASVDAVRGPCRVERDHAHASQQDSAGGVLLQHAPLHR